VIHAVDILTVPIFFFDWMAASSEGKAVGRAPFIKEFLVLIESVSCAAMVEADLVKELLRSMHKKLVQVVQENKELPKSQLRPRRATHKEEVRCGLC
jgi:hypothetical protein